MNSIGPPTQPSSPPSFIANPIARQATGQEETDTKQDIFKAVEESSETNASKTSPDSKDPTSNNTYSSKSQAGQEQSEQELAVIKDLAVRDREVRAHEQAHASVGGQFAGAASFTYQRGPDGVNYAIGGEVPISAPTGGDAESRLQAAEQIKRAALAPANPSAQDRQVAAQAAQTATQARAEIATQSAEARSALNDEEPTAENTAENQTPEKGSSSTNEPTGANPNSVDQTYRTIASDSERGAVFNQLA